MRPLPILKREFLTRFKACAPPDGWLDRIAVANSGGPDSTCLLFLMGRHLGSEGLPKDVLSLTVDHNLQPSSASMAEQAARTANSLALHHHIETIEWSQPPYPSKPNTRDAFEGLAREARYHALFNAMTKLETKIIAFGHHADDQVETSLMRVYKGSTELGAGGMKSCRRWGMGFGKHEDALGWAGVEGMHRWIVRPLLGFSKDRILATCEENKLEYVNDPTNFQPEVTLRNAVRYAIAQADAANGTRPPPPTYTLNDKLKTQLDSLTTIGLSKGLNISQGSTHLRHVVARMNADSQALEATVDLRLRMHRVPSPPSTFAFITHLPPHQHYPLHIRTSILLRIMRYVSYQPWGSPLAEAARSTQALESIARRIFDSSPQNPGQAITKGGGVMWSPCIIGKRGDLKSAKRGPKYGIRDGEFFGWVCRRQEPLSKKRLEIEGSVDTLQMDLTQKLKEAVGKGEEVMEVLYDRRFLLRFRLGMVPESILAKLDGGEGRLKVVSETKWLWPLVLWDSIPVASLDAQKMQKVNWKKAEADR